LDSFTDSNGDLVDEQILDGLLAHEVMHAFQYTEMSQLLGGGLSNEETGFMEGLSMAVQGGNSWIASIGGGITNADISGAFGGSTEEYASAFVAVKTLHEITVGGIGAVIDRLELGDSLDQAIANTTQQDQGEVVSAGNYNAGGNYTTFNQYLTDFNAGDFDTYLSASTDFTLGTGAITDAATAGSSSNLSLADTIPNGTGLDQVYTNFRLAFTSDSATSTPSDTPETVTLHIGANQGQTLVIDSFDATANGLGIDSVNATTQSNADASISIVDTALNSVSDIRSKLGAYQNRLEHTISNLDTSAENLQASESRIRDVDMAKEMMAFTKNNILQQAAQSMLAQANQAPQGVLQLLR
jgi:flagellin